jgi:hypothetical protein
MRKKIFVSIAGTTLLVVGLLAIELSAVGCSENDLNDTLGADQSDRNASREMETLPVQKAVVAPEVPDATPDAADNDSEEEMVIDEAEVEQNDTSAENEKSMKDSEAPQIVKTDGVMLNSIILARGVDRREPVEPGTQFTMGDGQKIYVILDVKNETGEDAMLTVSWKMPESDREIGQTELTVKSAKSWRTWSFTRWAKKTGTWEAVVRDAAGEIIARAPFRIVE